MSRKEPDNDQNEKRYVIHRGDYMKWHVARVPDNRPGEFHTKAEAARLILQGMDIILENAKRTRRQALRVLAIEKAKGRA